MKLKNLFILYFLTNLLVISVFAQNPADQSAIQNLTTESDLLNKRMELYLSNDDYLAVEFELLEKGYRFPALVKEKVVDGERVFEFKSYMINSSNREQMISIILNGVPNLLSVEITGSRVEATFNSNANKYHIATLFRILEYNSYQLV